MKHEERRREAGKMFIDISKYFFIAGIIGIIFSEKITVVIVIEIFVVALAALIIGFYIIPPKK